ncbi:hypothetical protein [Cohaesibacter celericrescens]|nr:hypothetical protein [Cohaesibacter celericrescens]
MVGCSVGNAIYAIRLTILCSALMLCGIAQADASAFVAKVLSDASRPQLEAGKTDDDSDLVFAFVTKLGQKDKLDDLDEDDESSPALEDGNLLSGTDILKAFDQRDSSERSNFLKDHALAAFFQHPASGKSVELQIAQCATLDYATGSGPFTQQVKCGEDLYSYRAYDGGLAILRNEEIHFSLPLDPGHYRVNGIDIEVN